MTVSKINLHAVFCPEVLQINIFPKRIVEIMDIF